MNRALAVCVAAVVAAACGSSVTVTPAGSRGSGTPAGTQTIAPVQNVSATAAQPGHAIAIREGASGAEFYERASGKAFVPRGVNYVYVPLGDTKTIQLLKVGLYDGARTRADFDTIAAAGYNTVRVFLDQCGKGAGCIGLTSGPGLDPGYLDNVADLIAAAKASGLQLLLTSNDLPDDGGYSAEANSAANGQFAGYRNSFYLTGAAVSATKRYWTDIVSGLRDRHAAFDAVLGWELVNEQWMFKDQPPLSLTSGSVSTTTGTYDMADAAAKKKMVSDGLVRYTKEVRAAILAVDPSALVSMGFFVPEIAAPDWYVDTAPLLTSADLDFFDFHAYPGGASIAKHAELFGMVGYSAKPIVMGEVGAFRNHYPTITSGARAVSTWIADSCDAGFDGWLYWAYYPADPGAGDQTWGFTDENGNLRDLFSPKIQADPCVPVAIPGANLAFGKPAKASHSLAGQGPELAFDENERSLWNAGAGPTQWIQVDLGAGHDVTKIRLVVAQDPGGKTVHRVLIRTTSGSSLTLAHTFSGDTLDGQELTFEPAAPLKGVRYVRIETTTSPSWVAWKEIGVFGE
jgi:hypothetical protein